MKRTIDTLNEMSFILPEGYTLVHDTYKLANGQGFINLENYLSQNGKVISLFEVHRDPDEFFASYEALTNDLNKLDKNYQLEKNIKLTLGDFVFPTYIIKGLAGEIIYTVQVFVNCGDCLGCFMITLNDYCGNFKEAIKTDEQLIALVKLLRTIE